MYTLLNYFCHVILIIFFIALTHVWHFFDSLLCSALQSVCKSRVVGILLVFFHLNAEGPEEGPEHSRPSIKRVVLMHCLRLIQWSLVYRGMESQVELHWTESELVDRKWFKFHPLSLANYFTSLNLSVPVYEINIINTTLQIFKVMVSS